jgi:uncharacterized protein (DUF2141 family)
MRTPGAFCVTLFGPSVRRIALVAGSILSVTAVWSANLDVEVRGVRPRAGDVHAAVLDRESYIADTEIRAAISASGEISAGIFTDDKNLPKPPVDHLVLPGTARTLHFSFPNLDPGEYAVGVYQDLNGNRVLDTTIARKATEPWGLSNNPPVHNRPVTWDEAKFTLPPEGARIVIELHLE